MDSKEKEQSLKLAEQYFRDENYSLSQYILDKVIEIDPANSKANELLSYIYGNLGKVERSFEFLKVACNQSDCSPEALYYFGSAQLKRHLFDQSIESLKKSISKGGEFFQALHDLASAYTYLGNYSLALYYYQKCLKIGDLSYEIFYNIARTCDELKRFDEAIIYYDKALNLKPDHAESLSNKGLTLHELKRFDEAITHYHKALNLKPDLKWIQSYLLHAKMKICSWSGFRDSLGDLSRKLSKNEKVASPFVLLSLSDDSLLHKKTSEIYAQDRYPFNPFLEPILKRSINEKIRIGYFSADFHNHATGYLMAELFELHDKSQFELTGFSFGPIVNDEMRQRLAKSFDQFIEVSEKSDVEIAQLSRNLNIDIAIDLKGFTQDARTGIFSYRAAPIQVNYLGYPGTMGIDYIDYIIADKTLIPLEFQSSYTEKVVYMPNSYQVNDRKRLISDKRFTRQELDLPDNGFIFCCFNDNYKILPETFDGWMRILNAVEGSILWLLEDNPWAGDNLKKEATNCGIDSRRLIFARRLPLSEHLSRHRQADLFLDTIPYGAHTTASDALWSGLPVLTLIGQSFAGRVAASLLNAIGLPELITNTQEEYEALAIELAMKPKKLADIKLKLVKNRLSTPLFDAPLFTKDLEAAYTRMFEGYQADLLPDHISIV